MLIGLKKRFVFVANSKAGSTALEKALAPFAEIIVGGTPKRKHIRWRDALKEYDFLFGSPEYHPETFFKFGVMRDPVDWICSWFRYRRGNNVQSPLPQHLTFAEFWELDDWTKYIGPGKKRKRLQKDFFCAEDGTVLVDCIIPYERLSDYFPQICTRLGIHATLALKNQSLIKKEAVDLAPDLVDEIKNFYVQDYEFLRQVPLINQRAGIVME